jgi:hypothetical protein
VRGLANVMAAGLYLVVLSDGVYRARFDGSAWFFTDGTGWELAFHHEERPQLVISI